MSTVSEALQQTMVTAIRAATRPCYACDGRKAGPDYDSPPEEIVLDDGRIATAYAAKPCEGCQGEGIIVAKPSDNFVSTMVLGAVLGEMFRAREANNTHSLNEALDWGMRYVLGTASAEGIDLADAATKFGEMVENSPLAEDLSRPSEVAPAGGLSQEELRELGVLEDDG